MMQGLENIMRREAARAGAAKAPACMGIVTAFDPSQYAVKVTLQPDGNETGFIPVASPWVGNGWGLFCPPTPGDVVDVHFQEGGKEAAYVSQRFFGDLATPQAVSSGEFWLVHQSGSSFKLTNDGKATITDKSGASYIFNADGTATLNADLVVNGTIQATGDITDNYTGTGSSMAHFRTIYDEHTHGGVQTGGGNTGTPNQTL